MKELYKAGERTPELYQLVIHYMESRQETLMSDSESMHVYSVELADDVEVHLRECK